MDRSNFRSPISITSTMAYHKGARGASITSHRPSCPRVRSVSFARRSPPVASTTLSVSSSTPAGLEVRSAGSDVLSSASATRGRLTEATLRHAGSNGSSVASTTRGRLTETELRHAGSDRPSSASATRGRLTEEALRHRIERILVEMRPRHDDDDGEESKIVVALRQALVDSSAFPTHFAD